MSAGKDGDLAPRSWKNYHRSQRGREMQRDLAVPTDGFEVTNWFEEGADADASGPSSDDR